MTSGHDQVRSYGGWRRSRSIGLLGLGTAGTLILLGCFAALLLIAAVSLKALLYIGPPALLAGAASLIRVGGISLASSPCSAPAGTTAAAPGTPATAPRSCMRHTGVLQLPGTLAATELLSAEDGWAAGTPWSATGAPGT